MPLRLIPDDEALAIDYLDSHASITALVGTRVSTQLPASPTFPYLTVQSAAGIEKDANHLDEAYLDLLAWANSKADAKLLIRTARAALLDAPNTTHSRGVVSHARTTLTPRWLPDESINPPRPRYVTTVALTIHPHLL